MAPAGIISSGWGPRCSLGAVRDGIVTVTLPPGPVEQFDFCQAFTDHGGKEKGEENATDQHVVVVVF